MRDLVVRTFCPLGSTMESSVDRELEVRNYNSYLEFYKKSKDDFVIILAGLLKLIVQLVAHIQPLGIALFQFHIFSVCILDLPAYLTDV